MNRYRGSFYKRLLGSDGHFFECVQGALDTRQTKSSDSTVAAAEGRYECGHRVPGRRLHARGSGLESSERS